VADPGQVVEFPGTPERGSKQENNLPLKLTSFIGREREISEVRSLLADHRLLTLTGTGGSGKTRLALAVAFEVAGGFDEGAWLVELASLPDPDLVPQAVASVLGVREVPGRPLAETLVAHLETKEMLLVLDNCEHLVDAVAVLADALLRSCPELRILATSRETLGIAGERTWLVPSLLLPDLRRLPTLEELARFEAIRLFVERAKGVVSAFELTEQNAPAVARVCRMLDGMPLAIELAAARVRVLSVEQICSRLEDSVALLTGGSRTADPRQRTLGATIEWSHDLLSEKEKILFGRLGVFAGGFDLKAAEEVCSGEGLEYEEVLDVLTHLIDKSLVMVADWGGQARYRLLETVRQYAVERLDVNGEAGLLEARHAQHYLALAEEAAQELREQQAWLARLEREHANFRAALSWALDRQDDQPGGRAELGLGLAAALAQGRFWNAYGPSEGRRWLEKGLGETTTSPTPVRAKALREAGWIATHQGDYERAVSLLEESMALFEELGDRAGVATSLVYLGHLALHRGDYERVTALGRDAEALRHELTDQQAIAHVLYLLGAAALSGGEHDRAITHVQESLALNRELGDSWDACICLTFLGIIALELGDPERAEALYGENMRLLQGLGDKTGISYVLRGMACTASLRGDAARASRLWGAAEAVSQTIGLPLSPFDRTHPDYEGLLASARSRLGDEAVWEAALEEGKAMSQEEAVEYALGTEDLASPPEDASPSLLSERETEVLRLVAEGLTNPEVAERLYLSPRTVGQHLRSVYRKLGVSSRAAAAREALERHLI
jgi:predicted ATPase/DNA-binding CsgD family transcriptional regulator